MHYDSEGALVVEPSDWSCPLFVVCDSPSEAPVCLPPVDFYDPGVGESAVTPYIHPTGLVEGSSPDALDDDHDCVSRVLSGVYSVGSGADACIGAVAE